MNSDSTSTLTADGKLSNLSIMYVVVVLEDRTVPVQTSRDMKFQQCGIYTGPRSAVGNVSGYRCVSDCRSRGREFDPGPVPYFRGD